MSSVKCVKCVGEISGVKYKIWNLNIKCGVGIAECKVGTGNCGVERVGVEFGVWGVGIPGCIVWSGKWRLWRLKCRVCGM